MSNQRPSQPNTPFVNDGAKTLTLFHMPPDNTAANAELRQGSSTIYHDGWSLHTVTELSSTNIAAAKLPAWHAVRANVQSAGRGRTGRSWISDNGGLWLSAVLPTPGAASPWSVLPLAVGWAIIGVLNELGASGLRLRWPNDIMSARRKLAGLLVERYTPETVVIGVGLNVFNRPDIKDTSLGSTTARLADLIPEICALDELTPIILRAIRRVQVLIAKGDFPLIANELNAHWSNPRLVSLLLNGHAHPFTGLFAGIDEKGRLKVTTDYADTRFYDAAQVTLLRELE